MKKQTWRRFNMRLSPSACERLARLRAKTECETDTETIRFALKIAELVVDQSIQGNALVIIDERGEKCPVLLGILGSSEWMG